MERYPTILQSNEDLREDAGRSDARLKLSSFHYVSKLGYRFPDTVPLFPRTRGKRSEFFVWIFLDFHRLVDCGKYFLPIRWQSRGNVRPSCHSDFYAISTRSARCFRTHTIAKTERQPCVRMLIGVLAKFRRYNDPRYILWRPFRSTVG